MRLGMRNARHKTGRRGTAAVEFALVLPLFMVLLLGVIEFAMIGSHKLTLTQAARAAVREASIGKPIGAVKRKLRGSSVKMNITDAQIRVELNGQDDGSGEWGPLTDSPSGTANVAPYGRLIRVRVVGWPHRLVTGPFFDWLPGVRGGALPLSGEMVMR